MNRFVALGIFGVFLFFSLTIWAQVPQLLNYQGRLTDDAGIPITATTTVRFSLHQGGDAATPGSGTLCYREDASVTPDDNGVFSHLIGSGTVISGALDSTVFQTAEPVYLEITIDPAGANETLLPRKQIVTVGYSFKAELADDADTLDGQDASAFAPMVHNHDPDYVNEGQPDSVNSSMIVNGTIVDADINAGANIAASKIDPTGLDADLLDGKDSLEFVHTTGDDMTGTLNVNTATQYALYGTTTSTSGWGVLGVATSTSGIAYGVFGMNDSSSGYGVYGYNSAGGYAGYFYGNAHVTGNLTVDGTILAHGVKPCVQPIDNGKKVLLYAMESPEIWFEDFGTAQLVNGQAVVPIEKVFAQTANIEMGYLIFLSPIGECQGLYIARQDKDAFEVRELGGGTSNNSFYYCIVAKRRGYEEVRFEEFTEPEQPPAEPNLPIERKEGNLK